MKLLNGSRLIGCTATLLLGGTLFAQSAAPEKANPCPIAPVTCAMPLVCKTDAQTSTIWERDHVLPPLKWGCEDEWSLQFGGSISARHEYRKNFDMNTRKDDNDRLSFLRTRVEFDLRYRNLARAFVELLDARASNYNLDPMQEDHWDVKQAFIELRDYDGSPWALRLGRMDMPRIGEGRIFGLPPTLDYDWFNLLPQFDGGMLEYNTKDWKVYTFLLQNCYYNTKHKDLVVTDRMRNMDHNWFYGMYIWSNSCAPHNFDLYFFGQSDLDDNRTWPGPVYSEKDKTYDTSDLYTVGSRLRGPICENECGTLGYGVEGTYQFGHRSVDTIQAYMLHGDINYQWKTAWKPKLTLQTNIATGDKSYGDDEYNRFNPLFGSSHYGYGTIDFLRLTNMREIGLVGAVEPCKNVKAQVGIHKFWLDSRTDNWVSATVPGSFGRDLTGQSGRDLGHEIDFTVNWNPNKRFSFETGLAFFTPGNYAKKQSRIDKASFFFAQTIFKF